MIYGFLATIIDADSCCCVWRKLSCNLKLSIIPASSRGWNARSIAWRECMCAEIRYVSDVHTRVPSVSPWHVEVVSRCERTLNLHRNGCITSEYVNRILRSRDNYRSSIKTYFALARVRDDIVSRTVPTTFNETCAKQSSSARFPNAWSLLSCDSFHRIALDPLVIKTCKRLFSIWPPIVQSGVSGNFRPW